MTVEGEHRLGVDTKGDFLSITIGELIVKEVLGDYIAAVSGERRDIWRG